MPNARINPPDDNCTNAKFSIKGLLIPVGFNELLGCPSQEPAAFDPLSSKKCAAYPFDLHYLLRLKATQSAQLKVSDKITFNDSTCVREFVSRFHSTKQPNARINPPDNNTASAKFLMRGLLTPVGFNELFGGPL
ncbi:MAG TPA: hypothetical protein VE732_01950 [Nitrososphaera sp.]|nr:hypothetical protein [Nitrososphaera sp.]